jgi:hypothetical protein
MSSFNVYKGLSKKKANYYTIFHYFGNITDIQNFNSRFKRVLTCGDSSCKDCLDDYQKLENKFIFFKDLEESLNRFYANITNSKYGGFNVGMLPKNIYELSSNDFIEHERNNPTVHESKINFDNDSLCVYSSIREDYGKITAYALFSGRYSNTMDIKLDGIMKYDMGFVDRYKSYSTTYTL